MPSREQVSERLSEVGRPVSENPLPYLIGAVILGVIVAYLIPHHQPTMRERYVDEPLDEMRSMLRKVLASVNKGAHHLGEGAATGARTAVDRVRGFWH